MKDGKIFGKINVIDLGVILLILVLGIGAYLKFGVLDKTKTTDKIDKIQYSIKLTNVRDYTMEAFVEEDSVYDAQTGTYIGKIIGVDSATAKEYISNASGEITLAELPGRLDVVLSIETPGTQNNEGYYANRSVELKVGSEKAIKTKYVECSGKIESIDYIKGE